MTVCQVVFEKMDQTRLYVVISSVVEVGTLTIPRVVAMFEGKVN